MYNRDTDEPVPADGPLAAAVFAALEEGDAADRGTGGRREGDPAAAVEREGEEGDDSKDDDMEEVELNEDRDVDREREREREKDEEAAVATAAAAVTGGRGDAHVVVIPLGDLAAAAERAVAADLLSHSLRTTDV